MSVVVTPIKSRLVNLDQHRQTRRSSEPNACQQVAALALCCGECAAIMLTVTMICPIRASSESDLNIRPHWPSPVHLFPEGGSRFIIRGKNSSVL
jgi:hypothetical protein